MPSAARRLLVIDQSLKGLEGHHYEYDRAVLDAASRSGLEPILACHRSFPAEVLGQARIVGRFSEDSREGGGSSLRNLLRRGLAGLPERPRHAVLRLAALRKQGDTAPIIPNARFAKELFEIIAYAKLEKEDHVLIHTLVERELLGLASRLKGNNAPLPLLHIVLRYDGTPASAQAFALLRHSAARVRLWTDTSPLAEHYRNLGAAAIDVLPIPHGLPSTLPQARKEGSPLMLAYLGGARGDKGFHLLPGLVQALADEYLAKGRVRFLIQANYALSLEEPLMAEAKRRLARFPPAWITLIEEPLDVAGFQTALSSTDLLLLPYNHETYRRRSSGLLVQAMVAGIPSVVPKGTWLATEAPIGGHVAFGNDLTFHDATRRALENFHNLYAAAREQFPKARARYDATRLVQKLMEVGS